MFHTMTMGLFLLVFINWVPMSIKGGDPCDGTPTGEAAEAAEALEVTELFSEGMNGLASGLNPFVEAFLVGVGVVVVAVVTVDDAGGASVGGANGGG